MESKIGHEISSSESRDSPIPSKLENMNMNRNQSPSQSSLSSSPSPSPTTLPSSSLPSPSSRASPSESTANNRCNSFSIDYILSKSVTATKTPDLSDVSYQQGQEHQDQERGSEMACESSQSNLMRRQATATSDLPNSLANQLSMIAMSQERAKFMAHLQSIASSTAKTTTAMPITTMTQTGGTAGMQKPMSNNPVGLLDDGVPKAKLTARNQQEVPQAAAAAAANQASNPNFLYFMACMLLQQQQQQQQRQHRYQTQARQQQLTQQMASSGSPPIEQQTSQSPVGPIDSLALLARLTGGAGNGNGDFRGANQPTTISSTSLQRPLNAEQQQQQQHQGGVSISQSARRQPYSTAAPQRNPKAQHHQPTNPVNANAPHAFMPEQLRRQLALLNPQMTLPYLAPTVPHAPPMANQFATMMTSMQQALDSMATNRVATNPIATPVDLPNQFDPEQNHRSKQHQLLLMHHKQQQQLQQQQQQHQMQRMDAQKLDQCQHKGAKFSSSHHHQGADCSQPKRSKTHQQLPMVQTGPSINQAQQQMNRIRQTETSGKQLDNMKPAHSYIGLIAMCILSTPEKRMVLNDIYQFILDHYPYYRNRGSGWRNSVRHNLSLNECFQKDIRAPNGKGHYWCIHPANMADFMNGDFRRRRAQRQVRRHNNMEVPSDESDDESMEDTARPPLPEHFKRSLEMHRQLELIYGKQPAQEAQQQQSLAQHRTLGLANNFALAQGTTSITTGNSASTSPVKPAAVARQLLETSSCMNGPAPSHLIASPSALHAGHHI